MSSPEKGTVFSAHKFSKRIMRDLLKRIYGEAARGNQVLMPDAAIDRMHERIAQLAGETDDSPPEDGPFPEELKRFDLLPMEKEAHHYAVDLYYASIRVRKGAPRLRPEYLDRIQHMHSQGLGPRKIAIKLGLGDSKQAEDRIRKQLRIAQSRTRK